MTVNDALVLSIEKFINYDVSKLEDLSFKWLVYIPFPGAFVGDPAEYKIATDVFSMVLKGDYRQVRLPKNAFTELCDCRSFVCFCPYNKKDFELLDRIAEEFGNNKTKAAIGILKEYIKKALLISIDKCAPKDDYYAVGLRPENIYGFLRIYRTCNISGKESPIAFSYEESIPYDRCDWFNLGNLLNRMLGANDILKYVLGEDSPEVLSFYKRYSNNLLTFYNKGIFPYNFKFNKLPGDDDENTPNFLDNCKDTFVNYFDILVDSKEKDELLGTSVFSIIRNEYNTVFINDILGDSPLSYTHNPYAKGYPVSYSEAKNIIPDSLNKDISSQSVLDILEYYFEKFDIYHRIDGSHIIYFPYDYVCHYSLMDNGAAEPSVTIKMKEVFKVYLKMCKYPNMNDLDALDLKNVLS
jgi:hypothetical protein